MFCSKENEKQKQAVQFVAPKLSSTLSFCPLFLPKSSIAARCRRNSTDILGRGALAGQFSPFLYILLSRLSANKGTITNQKLMEKILVENKIEVVISAVGGESILDQLTLVNAIKAVATVKRFLPSEFGHDIDRADPIEPGLKMYNEKRKVRRAIEEAGIEFTYVCCNSIAAWPYHDNTHPADVLPPLDYFHIYGDGNVKAYFVAGSDIGRLTIKVMNDKRTANKSVHFRPPNNLFSINELASLWEQKLKRNLPRITITEEDLLNAANEMRIPESIVAAFTHDIFIQGCQINFALDQPTDVEATTLYPDMEFRSIDECFDDFMSMIIDGHVMTRIKIPRSEALAITLFVA